MTRYYLQQNCRENAPVQAGDFKVQFEPAAFHAGQWWGIFGTDDERVQSALEGVIAAKNAGVVEVDEEEFVVWAKKKGTRQTHTWVVTESVSDHRPTPQPEERKSSADSAIDPEPDSDTEKGVTERPMDELLQTKDRDPASVKPSHVTSQSALAESLGISLPKVRELAKRVGSPGKTEAGYSIPKWESFLNRNDV